MYTHHRLTSSFEYRTIIKKGAHFAHPLLHPIHHIHTCTSVANRAMKGQTLQVWSGLSKVKEQAQGIDWNSICMLLHYSILVHAHLLNPVRICGLINQVAKKLVSSLASLSSETCEGKKPKTESTTSVIMTQKISSRESSCLSNTRPLYM